MDPSKQQPPPYPAQPGYGAPPYPTQQGGVGAPPYPAQAPPPSGYTPPQNYGYNTQVRNCHIISIFFFLRIFAISIINFM